MKKLFVAALMICLYLVSLGQDLSKLDAKNGFRDAIFGMNIGKFSNLTKIDGVGDNLFYVRTTDVLKLGDFELYLVYYAFYKNQLYSVTIKTKGYVNSIGALRVLQSAYGEGKKENEYIEDYQWLGKDVFLIYEENSYTSDASITFMSIPLSRLMKEDAEKAANEAAKGL